MISNQPARLNHDCTIGLINPSGSCPDDEYLAKYVAAIKVLEQAGFKVKYYESVLSLVRGSALSRAREFTNMYLDPEVDILLATKGGDGCIEILEHLDFELLKSKPKAILGYSDLTTLALTLYSEVPFFHAPMLFEYANDQSFEEIASLIEFTNTYLGDQAISKTYIHKSKSEKPEKDKNTGINQKNRPLELARAKFMPLQLKDALNLQKSAVLDTDFRILGANLSILVSLLGTKYLESALNYFFYGEQTKNTDSSTSLINKEMEDSKNAAIPHQSSKLINDTDKSFVNQKTLKKVLFLEECYEPEYKIRRILYQLKYAGFFKNIDELWLGTSLEAPFPEDLGFLLDGTSSFKIIRDLPIGHAKPNFICPLF
jgi:muramoyltetrapeptide carboxypeptidase LdcA involved in peptidoglycan recycling